MISCYIRENNAFYSISYTHCAFGYRGAAIHADFTLAGGCMFSRPAGVEHSLVTGRAINIIENVLSTGA
jgi:hypothetical protein